MELRKINEQMTKQKPKCFFNMSEGGLDYDSTVIIENLTRPCS